MPFCAPVGAEGLQSFKIRYCAGIVAALEFLARKMHDATENSVRPVVLIVEDEVLLRMHATAVIEAAGFDTVEASNADDAIAILEARKDIRVVFTDIEMPGMDGLKLSRAIRDRWPPIEIILTSGKRHPQADDLPERGQFFPKPYNPDALIAAITHFANC